MAKSDSILKFQGTYQGTTFVQSRSYGDHICAARGKHKPAVVNKVLKQESTRLQNASVPAKILKDALDPYREDFKGGQLWQRLVSQFQKQLYMHGEIDFGRVEPVEVNERYPLSRFLIVDPKLEHNTNSQLLQVTLDYSLHPKLKGLSYLNGYRIGVVGIFPDLTCAKAFTTVVYSPVMSITLKQDPLMLSLTIPDNASAFVLCLKIEGCEQDKASRMLRPRVCGLYPRVTFLSPCS